MSGTAVRSLAEFVRDKKREGCPVCKLPEDVREQLRTASKRLKIGRDEQVEWLHKELKVNITDEQLTAHYSGKH